MGEAALKRLTVDEFLAWDGEGDRRYELIGGEIVAMAPPVGEHSLIAGNAIREIGQKLRPPCRVMSQAGIRLSWRNDSYYQADIVITCSPVMRGQWGAPDPVAIIEVLSHSAAARDRGVKLVDYRQIPSVQDIILIASDQMRVEHWRRGAAAWTVVDLAEADSLHLASFGFDIAVQTLYDGLDFSQGAVAHS